jgi:hypothetical protein
MRQLYFIDIHVYFDLVLTSKNNKNCNLASNLADNSQHIKFHNQINIIFINEILLYFNKIFKFIHFCKKKILNMCLNFGDSNQIQLKSKQQNRVITRNHGYKSDSNPLISFKLKNWGHTKYTYLLILLH